MSPLAVRLLLTVVAVSLVVTPVAASSSKGRPQMCEHDGVWSPSDEWYSGDTHYCYCDNGRWIDCTPLHRVTATFDTPLLSGEIWATQGYDKTSNVWYARFDKFDQQRLCPSGELNWHVHEGWSSAIKGTSSLSQCSLDLTGNHYDPTFGCGPASQFAGKGGLCELVRPQASGIQTCDLSDDVSTCEIGDLSAKLGRVFLKKGIQAWDDSFSTNVENFRQRSVVLHCCSKDGCSPRVACAQFL